MRRDQAREVVVTGAGAVGPHGLALSELREALRSGRPFYRALAQPSHAPLPSTHGPMAGAACPELDLSPWLAPRAARRMSSLSKWAVVSGRMALESSGWPEDAPDDLAICFATTFGPAEFTQSLIRQILRESPTSASPFLFTDCVANAPAGQMAIAMHARGANFTVSQREAGPLLALIHATLEVRAGRAKAVLAGAADELERTVLELFHRMRASVRDAKEVRPLDQKRCGVLLGEGASCLVIEDAESASARDAKALARVAFVARAFDPTAERASWGTGAKALGTRLRDQLLESDIELSSIEAVVSGASGARAGDRLEALVLREVFAEKVPPVLLPKAVIGEYGGGILVPALLALDGGSFCAPAGFSQPDPELGVQPFAGEFESPPRRVLVTGLGSGGAAAFVVLDAV